MTTSSVKDGLPSAIVEWGAMAMKQRDETQANSSFSVWSEEGKARRIRPFEPCFQKLYYKPNVYLGGEYFVSCAYFEQYGDTASGLEYIRFLTDPARSPWHNVLDHLVVKDADWIAEHGFVFSGLKTINRKLFYNFLMATRTPWEIPNVYETARNLMEHGFSERKAHFASHVWVRDKSDGAYSAYSGATHSYLCDQHKAYGAYRFINACPRLEPGDQCTPSDPIWYSGYTDNHLFDERYRVPRIKKGGSWRDYIIYTPTSIDEIICGWLEHQETCHKLETQG